jgi:hypothetical protein
VHSELLERLRQRFGERHVARVVEASETGYGWNGTYEMIVEVGIVKYRLHHQHHHRMALAGRNRAETNKRGPNAAGATQRG